MKTSLSIGKKISLGFLGVIAITVTLGSMSIWTMTKISHQAQGMVTEQVPTVVVANNIERSSLSTMYEMRGYGLSEDPTYYQRAEKNLAEVKQHLNEAKELAAKSADLAGLKTAAEKAEGAVQNYEQLAAQTVTVTDALEKDRAAMNVAAQKYMKVCADYLEDQNARLSGDLAGSGTAGAANAGINVADVQDRIRKLSLANEIIDLGNAIRIGNFKSQATRDPELFRDTQKKFTEVNQKLDALKAVTKLELNLKQIEECRAAGNAYSEAMTGFLKNWLAREDLAKKRGQAADAVLAEAKSTALGGLTDTGKAAEASANSLSTANTVMIVGLFLAVLVSVGVALLITRLITKPLHEAVGLVKQVSTGDLTTQLEVKTSDFCSLGGCSRWTVSPKGSNNGAGLAVFEESAVFVDAWAVCRLDTCRPARGKRYPESTQGRMPSTSPATSTFDRFGTIRSFSSIVSSVKIGNPFSPTFHAGWDLVGVTVVLSPFEILVVQGWRYICHPNRDYSQTLFVAAASCRSSLLCGKMPQLRCL